MAPTSSQSNGESELTRREELLAVATRLFAARGYHGTRINDVADRRDHVLVTRNGKPAAALVPIDEYEALEETAEILSDSPTLAAIEAGLADLARGDSVTLDELRPELAQRRAVR